MNKNGLYFLLGLAVGGLVSFLATKKYYDKKITAEVIKVREELECGDEDQKEAEEPEIDGYYTSHDAEFYAKHLEHPDIDAERKMTSDEIDLMKKFDEDRGKKQRMNYNGINMDPDGTVAAMYAAKDLAKDAAAEQEHPRDSDEDDPIRIISEREYHEEHCTDYGKIELTFYEEDNALCDDDEELISDPSKFIGEFALSSFGQDSDDLDVVYVRNVKQANDYCITRLHMSYAEVVLGIIPDADVDTHKIEARRRMKDEE